MQSSSKKRVVNTQQEQKYDLPFFSTENKNRRVASYLLKLDPNVKLIGGQDSKQLTTRSIQKNFR